MDFEIRTESNHSKRGTISYEQQHALTINEHLPRP